MCQRFNKLRKLRETQAALPIAQYREEIIQTLAKYNVLIIAGDTGCGKSTQLPQFLLRAGYENIACTQPRRIACVSLSKRVAYETLNEYSSQIGYQIRFEKSKTQHTKVVFITEGLLLRQVSTDSMLSNYNVIVLDEVHERHLHGDFLLGIVKCLVYQRQDVKIILMSATINTELFQNYFQGLAPILQVPGRLYPIKVHYRPISVEELTTRSGKLNPAPYVRVLQLIDDKFPQDERGDVLMFLSGVNEISIVAEATKVYADVTKRWIILPLHSMLSIDDQDKAFDYPPEGIRKCIIATNIAETSITIDGIRFVVDSGKVKEMAYDPTSKLQRLKEFWISRASAEQRKGRAGRTGPGVCYRIYSEAEYDELQPYSTPEIQRVPLDSLLLQMIAIGIPDCRKFPFIEPPSEESMENSLARLKEQGALNDDESLTPIGKTLSNLPVDVMLGKMLIMGTLFEQVQAVLSLAAAMSVQSPLTSWAQRDPDCVAARKSLESDHGDPLTLLNAYRAWLEEKADDGNRTKKWCKRRGFEEQRFYEMTKLRQQFKALLKDSGLLKESQGPSVSSAERSMRHGEVKQLRSLKKEYHMTSSRKKKFLKLDSEYGQGEDLPSDNEEDGDGSIDIKDVEFRLRNDSRQVKDLLHTSSTYGYEDVTMLKVILCSGLYPQYGVPDDFNKYKVALTRTKCFIHGAKDLRTLLETNKPYLMNTTRMPAVQSLILFAHTIDTDPAMTRFVFDSWMEVVFTDSASARMMLICGIELRDTWSQLLKVRLMQIDEPQSSSDTRKGRELSFRLVKFLRSETFYTIKRLLAADQKDMYNKHTSYGIPSECDEDELRFESGWDVMHNMMKGGLSLTSFLTFGCR
ncbi:putative ATP-dependent RNA helicase DHX34 [Orchesella cincta]|uniref:Putative ATP-dependent RNA helicase DHX34 n=1 Tax=Orchesella cincta TaxID=48709 RepID=A0A1D2N7X6_ORCCI|nr:putative ATP-dependent RNA helicase DHX34 [Orchesella cincta]